MIALGGWTLNRPFKLSKNQAVNNDKVNKLERYVEKLQNQMDDMMDKDKEIMQQHENLFKALQKDDKPTGSYNY